MNDELETKSVLPRRRMLGMAAGGLAFAAMSRGASGATERVRIGLPTKTWWPTILVETATREGLFEKAGIEAELTIYRSGGEAFEALAANAADLVTGVVSQVATGRKRGVASKIVALAQDSNTGWRLLVRRDAPYQNIRELSGKKIGITTAGSVSDFLALWSRQNYKIDFSSLPLGGGGLVPNLLTGNVDAAVVYSPLSFQMLQAGQARELIDYAKDIPPYLCVGWAVKDAMISERSDTVRRALKALYQAVAFLQGNRDSSVAAISALNSVPAPVASQEFYEAFMKLSLDGRFTIEQARRGLELARIGGFENLATAEEIISDQFTPIVVAK